jgi:Glycosyl hydrolase family 63 N-terminal domain
MTMVPVKGLQALPRHVNLIAISLFLTLCFSNLAACEVFAEGAALNGSLLWGPYRPNLYFGIRPRIPKSLLAGLMWAKVDNFATVQNSECCSSSTAEHVLTCQRFPRPRS